MIPTRFTDMLDAEFARRKGVPVSAENPASESLKALVVSAMVTLVTIECKQAGMPKEKTLELLRFIRRTLEVLSPGITKDANMHNPVNTLLRDLNDINPY